MFIEAHNLKWVTAKEKLKMTAEAFAELLLEYYVKLHNHFICDLQRR